METYIKNIRNDITYKSELVLDIFFVIKLQKKCQGFNSHSNLRSLSLRKLRAH